MPLTSTPSKEKTRLKKLGWSDKQMTEQFILKETQALKPRVPGIFDEELGLLELHDGRRQARPPASATTRTNCSAK